MYIQTKSFHGAYETLEPDLRQELLGTCRSLPRFDYLGKSPKNSHLIHCQQLANAHFCVNLNRAGWEEQPIVHEDLLLKSDFAKCGVLAEVQFGNAARSACDILKGIIAAAGDWMKVFVMILPDLGLSKKTDSNVTYFERVIRELSLILVPTPRVKILLPLLVIGLSDRDTPVMDVPQLFAGKPKLTLKNCKKIITEMLDNPTSFASQIQRNLELTYDTDLLN